eukprot:m.121098 g.121098  ORF g.121098 m.121098 type:complete len:618 (-) comp21877_c0_seq4:429-2282(-)
MRQWFVGTALASLVAIWLMSTTLVPHRRRGISRRFRSGSVNRSAAVRGVSLSLQRDAVRRLVIPLPAGTPTASVPPSIAGVPSSILPACFTIVHVGTTNISELVAAAGGTADELGDVLMANPDLGWHALGIAQMQLYAQRHGHNYRLVVLEGDAVEFGPDQTARHPAWTRVPMLSNVYHDGAGAELLLNPECPAREQWLLYVDMDVVIGATNFSLEQIVRGYNASGQYHTGLPCQAEYDAGTFPTAANVTAANGTAGFCHNAKVATGLRKTLAPPLLVSDSAESVMMAFEDGYRNHAKCTSNAPTFSCPAMGGMPCSAVLLFRVPTPTRGGAAAAASTDGQPKSTQTRLLDVGRAMVDTWASARLEPGLTDPEDFLAMAWAGPANHRHGVAYDPSINVATCREHCYFAGDQGVLNRAVVAGLPHRPFHPDDPDNKHVGRFIPHVTMLKCGKCIQGAGGAFSHLTGWTYNKPSIRLFQMLRMGWELHGLDLLFTVCRAARLANFAGMTKVCRDGRRSLQDRVGISVARAWLRNCSTSSNAQMDAACALSPAAAEAAGAATTALFHVLSQLWTGGHTLKLQRSRRSAHPGPASEKAGTGWYGIVPLDAPRTAGSHTSTT